VRARQTTIARLEPPIEHEMGIAEIAIGIGVRWVDFYRGLIVAIAAPTRAFTSRRIRRPPSVAPSSAVASGSARSKPWAEPPGLHGGRCNYSAPATCDTSTFPFGAW
jgi:hypothetical protein